MKIIYAGIKSWDYPLKPRAAYMSEEFVEQGHQVLIVNPIFVPYPETEQSLHQPSQLTEVRKGLHVFNPSWVAGSWLGRPDLCAQNYEVNRQALRDCIHQLEFEGAMLIVSQPLDIALIGSLYERFTLYDYQDAYEEYFPELRPFIEPILRQSDGVVCVSDLLYEHASRYNQNTVLVRTGTDLHATHGPSKSRSKVCYLGTMNERVNTELIRLTANAYPHVEFVMIGPVQVDVSALAACPNVCFTGELDHHDLASTLPEMRVGLIPFVINRLTQATDPEKMYKYLAADMRVVSTDIQAVARLQNVCLVAQNPAEFIELVGQALTTAETADERLNRAAVVQNNTWQCRAKQLLEWVNRWQATTVIQHSHA